MILVIKSKNEVSIRLTSERWTHITTSHTDMNDNKDTAYKTSRVDNIVKRGVIWEK